MTGASFKPTIANHFRQTWTFLIYAQALTLGPAIVWYKHGAQSLPLAYSVAVPLFLAVFVPHAILHVRYNSVSRGMSFVFKNKHQIEVRRAGVTRVVGDVEIDNVECVLHRSLSRNETTMYPWQTYGFAIVRLVTGEHFVITTLAVPDLRWPYEFCKATIREVLYPWPPYSSLK